MNKTFFVMTSFSSAFINFFILYWLMKKGDCNLFEDVAIVISSALATYFVLQGRDFYRDDFVLQRNLQPKHYEKDESYVPPPPRKGH